MKKIFMLLAAVAFSATMFSQEVETEFGEITIISNENGIVEFTWNQEENISDEYRIFVGVTPDGTRKSEKRIADIGIECDEVIGKGEDDENGRGEIVFSYSTDRVLENGSNYASVGWLSQEDWETHVNEDDYSLNPGDYVLTVQGYSFEGIGEEKEDYNLQFEASIVFHIAGAVATGVENVVKEIRGTKLLINGAVVIEANGSRYTISGQKL